MEKNAKALLYCSVWPEEEGGMGLDAQSVELQTYCLLNHLEVVDILHDVGPYERGRLRPGLERLLELVMSNRISHVVAFDIGRICRETQEAMAFLRDAFDPQATEIHLVSWNMSTGMADCRRYLGMVDELLDLDRQRKRTEGRGQNEKLRTKPMWQRIFGLLQDERYAEVLIKALFQIKDEVRLSDAEFLAVHGGYDHLNMFRALGFRIKAERTENTKLVTDVLVRFWEQVKRHVTGELTRTIEGTETAIS